MFEGEEREHFPMFMRIYENFSGCRVLSNCVMSNPFHTLLEVRRISGREMARCLAAISTFDGMVLERQAMNAKVDSKHVPLKTINTDEALESGQNDTV